MNEGDHRKFIHDMANNLSVVDASLTYVLRLLKKSHPQLEDEIRRLTMAQMNSGKCIETLKSYRASLQSNSSEAKP